MNVSPMKNKGEILAAILSEFKDCYFFLHNTKDFATVEKIMRDGFIFESQLPHSTDRVNPNEPIEITYFFFQRKDYGQYTMVMAIPRKTYENYTRASDIFDTGIEEVMTITEPYLGDNDEPLYTISPKHVLGYFSIRTTEFFRNPVWDPDFDNSAEKEPFRKTFKPDKRQ